MYNSDSPLRAELPSSPQLLRSTLIAALTAGVLLVSVVLPAEYAIDPLGIGRVLRLTEMGEIKQQLATEAAADAAPAAQAKVAATAAPQATPEAPATATAPAAAAQKWQDEIRLFLKPGEGTEVKMRMNQGEKVEFEWTVSGGVVNFDAHGDGAGRSISYEKGRGVPSDQGELQAAFSGNHGWFFRNREGEAVTVVLRTRGQYVDLKRVL